MKRRVQKVVALEEVNYPRSAGLDRREFLKLLAVGSAAVALGFPSLVFADSGETLLSETMQLSEGYWLELSRTPDERGRRALGEARQWLIEYVDQNVTPAGMHDPILLQTYNDALRDLLVDALSPSLVVDVQLFHDCDRLCPNRQIRPAGLRMKVQ